MSMFQHEVGLFQHHNLKRFILSILIAFFIVILLENVKHAVAMKRSSNHQLPLSPYIGLVVNGTCASYNSFLYFSQNKSIDPINFVCASPASIMCLCVLAFSLMSSRSVGFEVSISWGI